VCLEPLGAKLVVAGEQDFGHDVALHAVELEVVFGAEVVEAVDFMLAAAVGVGAVLVDYRVAVLVELEADIPTWFYLILVLGQQ